MRECKYPDRYPSESPGWWKWGGEGQGNGLLRADRTGGQVGEPEGNSVTKSGVCRYASRGRDGHAKPGGTAGVKNRFCPSAKCGGQGCFFIRRILARIQYVVNKFKISGQIWFSSCAFSLLERGKRGIISPYQESKRHCSCRQTGAPRR